MKIVITARSFVKYGQDAIAKMKAAGFDVYLNETGASLAPATLREVCKDADGAIVALDTIDREFIDACPRLKAIVRFGVGMDSVDVDYAKKRGIFVGRTVGVNSRSVAEIVFCYMFASARNFYDGISATRGFSWPRFSGFELCDKTVGIVGFGAVGKEVARMAHGLNMRVLAYNRSIIDKKIAEELCVTVCDLATLLKNADFVTLHVPLTDATKNLISGVELRQMKKNAVLINTARGGIVNENDLYEALSKNVIRAAYFDVFSSEPPKVDEPLFALPNFFLTPHCAARTVEAERRTVERSTKILLEALGTSFDKL